MRIGTARKAATEWVDQHAYQEDGFRGGVFQRVDGRATG